MGSILTIAPTTDNYDSGYVFMVIEASSDTSMTLPDNVTVIQSTCEAFKPPWS